MKKIRLEKPGHGQVQVAGDRGGRGDKGVVTRRNEILKVMKVRGGLLPDTARIIRPNLGLTQVGGGVFSKVSEGGKTDHTQKSKVL